MPDKLIQYGQALADSLQGEDLKLYKIAHSIEQSGYQNLDVKIVSSNRRFQAIPWETLILPESSYVLSTVCRSFERAITETKSDPAVNLTLTTPQKNNLPGLQNHSQPSSDAESEPLRVLYCLLRTKAEHNVEVNVFNYQLAPDIDPGMIRFDV